MLRNLPLQEGKKLKDLIDYRSNQVVSMSLTRGESIQMVLFAFDSQENISEEVYFGDTMYLVVDGKMKLQMGETERIISEGEIIAVPAGTPHAIGGIGAFKLLQINASAR